MKVSPNLLVLLLVLSNGARGQLLFTSGSDTNQLLFERINGNSVQVPTGVGTHELPGLSRGGRFVSFRAPEPVQGNGINPSADIFIYDRAAGQTRLVIDHFSSFDGVSQTWNTGLSSQVSPDGSLIAYGVAINRATGATGGQLTNELNIATTSTGFIVSNPTSARGPTSDPFAGEFRGISFAPDGNSFVTPLYRLAQSNSPLPTELPAISRFARDAGGQWFLAAVHSTPVYQADPLTGATSAWYHTYPALSPSGQGLAYFQVHVPDASFLSQPWISSVVVANADGSGAQLLTSFAAGFVPTGMTWSTDGTALIVSISQQSFESGYLPAPRRGNSAVFSVSTSDGSTSQIGAIGNSLAPMLPGIVPTTPDLAGVRLRMTRSQPGFVLLQATGLAPDAVVTLETSQNSLSSFQAVQLVSGDQLASGLEIPINQTSRFFRLAN